MRESVLWEMDAGYYGILVDSAFSKLPGSLRIIGKKRSQSNPWNLLKAQIPEDELEETISLLRESLLPGYNLHIYSKEKLIVCFKDKVFRISPDESSWKEAAEYGESLGIPREQRRFFPARPEDETY